MVDGPYVSDFLISTIERNNFLVIHTETASKFLSGRDVVFISQKDALNLLKLEPSNLLYCNSENSISWIEENMPSSDLMATIRNFKNKSLFRELLRDIYPDFHFITMPFDELKNFNYSQFQLPFIVKPNVGFFSLGVYKVESNEGWTETLKNLEAEIQHIKNLYPTEVLNTQKFIIEECIRGDEYAIDCYYNKDGNPVILDILQHLFSSGADVNDRVYITSKDIIESTKDPIEAFLVEVGNRANLKNFPVHIEVRIDAAGKIAPIEFNPMRFGGWCSTPDLAWHAWGMNVYEYFYCGKHPDWKQLLKGKQDVIYSNIVLNNNTGIPGKAIQAFNYDKLLADFQKPLELRKADFRKFPLFGFLFTETRKSKIDELLRILHSNLKEYILQ